MDSQIFGAESQMSINKFIKISPMNARTANLQKNVEADAKVLVMPILRGLAQKTRPAS